MKSYLQKMRDCALALFTATLIAGTVVACNGSSDAGTTNGVSQSAFNALVKRVEALEAANEARSDDSETLASLKSQLLVQAVTADSEGKSTQSLRHVESATNTSGTVIGTIIGYAPAEDGPLKATAYIIGNDTTHVRAIVEMGDTGAIGDNYTLVYESPDCQGQPYLRYSWLPRQVNNETLAAGLVLRHGENYWYLAPNTEPQTVNEMSTSSGGSGCSNEDGGGVSSMDALAIVPNDPSVSGWANAPAGQVVRGTPQ